MFVGEFLRTPAGKRVSSLNCRTTTYPVAYNFWSDNLFERAMRLFVWECDPVPPKEIETRLLLNGTCGIAEYDGELTAFFGMISGVTKYYDEGTHYNVSSPVYADYLRIGEDVVVMDNNSLRNPLYPLIHEYAVMLAHVDVTINFVLVNMRDTSGKPVAGTQKSVLSIKQYLRSLVNGKIDAILDPAFMNVKFTEARNNTNSPIKDLVEIRRNILSAFYSDIGVKTTWNKKGNMIANEVEGDNTMLLVNISDMLASRKKSCEAVNRRFGTNWNVRLNPEMEYREEIEVKKNASETE